MRNLLACWLAAVAAAAPASAIAGPKIIWAKPGVSSTEMEADFGVCLAQSKQVTAEIKNGALPGNPGPAAYAGAAIGSILYEIIETPIAQAAAAKACMWAHGYHAISLNPDESAEMAAIKQPELASAWVGRFYERPDFAGRLANVTGMRLPEADVSEPFAYGAMRLDPSSLALPSGVVPVNGAVVSGKASHRATGRLLRDVASPYYNDGHMLAERPLEEAVLSGEGDTPHTYWCGAHNFKNTFQVQPACLRNDADGGFVMIYPEGADWIATGIEPQSAATVPSGPDVVFFEQSPSDLVGPFDFTMVVLKLTDQSVTLRAVVTRGDDDETLWKDTLSLDPDGKAALPFWSHRLVLTRTGNGVSVTFPSDGDGTGWPYVRVRN